MKNSTLLILCLLPYLTQAQVWNRLSDVPNAYGGITSSPLAPSIMIYNSTLRSSDRGYSWEMIDVTPFTKPQFLTWHPTVANRAYFRAMDGNTPMILRTDDAGTTFVGTSFPPVDRLYFGADPSVVLGLEKFALSGWPTPPPRHRIWLSRDAGQTWANWSVNFTQYIKSPQPTLQCIPNYEESRYFTFDPQRADRVYQYVGSYQSDNAEHNWERVLVSASYAEENTFSMLPSTELSNQWNPRLGLKLHLFSIDPMKPERMTLCGAHLVRSSFDTGNTWLQSPFPHSPINTAAIDWEHSTLMVGSEIGISSTTTFGNTWSPLNKGLQSLDVRSVHYGTDGIWYAATNEGFYELVETITSVNQPLENGFALEQNFPNPFTSSTIVRFSTPSAFAGKNARLTVHDALGREVTTLFEGNIRGTSESMLFTPGNLPTGLYLIRLQIADQTLHRAMTYIGR